MQGRLIRIAALAADRYEFLDDPVTAVDGLRSGRVRIDLFTFIQKLPHVAPKYGYPMEWEPVAALPLSTFDHWWASQINDKTRNMVRRAEKKGVVVREVPFDDTLVQGIQEIYNESPIRQGKPFWHYGKDLDTVRRENGTFRDRSVFIGAFLADRLIGFAKLVCDDDRGQAALMQILSMVQHRDKAPTNAVLAQAVRSVVARGIQYLVYTTFLPGTAERDGLGNFKHHNGFQRIEVPRYYVPLTVVGRAALRLGWHRGVGGRLPEPLRVRLRQLRRLWYAAPATSADPLHP